MRMGIIAAIAASSVMLLSGPAGAVTVPALVTYAGGTGGPGLATDFSVPATVVAPVGGAVYLSDRIHLWQLNESTDQLTTLNTGRGGSASNGLPARAAHLVISGMAADSYGNLLIAEGTLHVVRILALHTGKYYGQAMRLGDVYTIADKLVYPSAVTVDHEGNVVINAGAGRIRVLAVKDGTFFGQAMKAGSIYTVYYNAGSGIVVDGSGNLVYAENNGVWLYAESTGTFFGQSMVVDHYYQIASANRIPSILTDGAGNVLFTDPITGTKVVAARTGTFYNESMTEGGVYPIARAGGYGIALDTSGVLLIPGSFRLDPFTITATPFKSGTFYNQAMTPGNVYKVAGNGSWWSAGIGGPAATAQFEPGSPVSADTNGNVFLAGVNNSYVIQMIAGKSGTYFGQPMRQGNIYTIAGGPLQAPSSCPAGSALKTALNQVVSLVVDSYGNLVFADPDYHQDGCTEVLAQRSGDYYGQQMVAGNIYSLHGFDAHFIAVDHFGNLVTAGAVWPIKSGTYYGQPMSANQVYQVAGGGQRGVFSGVPGTQAYLSGNPADAPDAQGNLLIAADDMIRVLANRSGTFYGMAMKAGWIYRIAGLVNPGPVENGIPALNAHLNNPTAIGADSAGNVVIADTGYNMLRVVAAKAGTFYGQAMKAGYIYLLAGNGQPTLSGIGGPAAKASLPVPAMAILPDGDVVIPDTGDHAVLEININGTQPAALYSACFLDRASDRRADADWLASTAI